MTIRLRPGKPADLPAMYALDHLCFDERFQFELETMRRFATEKGAIVVLAEEGGTLAGFVILNMQHVPGGPLAYVTTLDVEPSRRRAGLAGKLMAAAEARAHCAGATWAGLHVFVDNAPAIAFYERNGYERVGIDPDFYGEGLGGWQYRKPLGAVRELHLRQSGQASTCKEEPSRDAS